MLNGLDAQSEMELSIDSIVYEAIDSMSFPGAQILIAKEGEIVFEKAYGYHTYDKSNQVELDHLYDLASITKVSTGLPILINLVAKGKVGLDEPVYKYLPILKRSNKANLTIREILAHQAGLKPYIVYWRDALKEDGNWRKRSFKAKRTNRYNVKIADDLYLHKKYYKKIRRSIKDSELLESKDYRYSGLFFLLLPQLIEKIKGRPFLEVLQQEVYDPIGIKDLTYKPSEKYRKERIVPTEMDSMFRNQLVHGNVHDEAAAMMDGVACNAGLFANARSLYKLFQVYVDEGVHEGRRYIDAETLKEFTSCVFCEEGNRRGLGFDKPLLEYDEVLSTVAKDASPESFGHSGFTGTLVWADPVHDLIYVFLSNRVHPTRDHKNIYKLNVRPRIHQIAYDHLVK